MAGPSASIRLKRLRQRFGISAPKVAVRTNVAWYWRAAGVIGILSISFAFSAWIYDAGKRISKYQGDNSVHELQSLRNYVMELDAELTKLRGLVGSGESRLQIERATQQQLSRQVKQLENENAALKQDLAFFEGLMPSAELGGEPRLRVDKLLIEQDEESGAYRYRMLVINSGGRQAREIKGALQLHLKVQEAGKDVMIVQPSGEEGNSQRFHFEIKHFLRLDGVFSVPTGAVLKAVEVRLLQDGVVRAAQSATL